MGRGSEEANRRLVSLTKIGGVARIYIDRPEKVNALNRQVYAELNEALTQLDRDPELRVGVILSAGPNFSGGADLRDIAVALAESDSEFPQDVSLKFEATIEWLEHSKKPIICAMQGKSYGGGVTLALACDFRIATPSTTFCLPEVKVGVASVQGTIRAVQRIGLERALEMLVTGASKDAAWAEKVGLVSQVVPEAELEARAMAWAQEIAEVEPSLVAATRAVAYAALSSSFKDAEKLGVALRSTARLNNRYVDTVAG